MNKIAFLFPGQGSQKVGMGRDLHEHMEAARELFRMADEVTGLPITRLCFEGPMETLTETVNLQPAITVVNLVLLAELRKHGIRPAVCAGHSLGEYTALAAAGVITAADCLRLVMKRGELMHREATRRQGAMSAIVGLDIEQVGRITAQASETGVVAVANHNSATQIVITGEPEAVRAAADMTAAQGAKTVPLKVSGAWHSPLIQGAEADFRQFLGTVEFREPGCPVLHNVTAAAEPDPGRVRELLARQLCSPVRWYDAMTAMIGREVDTYVEIGPGRVLTGLMKKILPQGGPARLFNVSDVESLNRFVEAC